MWTSQKRASASASFSTAAAAAPSSDGSSGFQSLSPRAKAGSDADAVMTSAKRRASAPGRRRGKGDFILLNLSGRKESLRRRSGSDVKAATGETNVTQTGRRRRD